MSEVRVGKTIVFLNENEEICLTDNYYRVCVWIDDSIKIYSQIATANDELRKHYLDKLKQLIIDIVDAM